MSDFLEKCLSVWLNIALALALTLVLAIMGVSLYLRIQEIQIENKQETPAQAYDRGYEEGVAAGTLATRDEFKAELPKACTNWWFGTSAQVRHKEAAKVYCKGKV